MTNEMEGGAELQQVPAVIVSLLYWICFRYEKMWNIYPVVLFDLLWKTFSTHMYKSWGKFCEKLQRERERETKKQSRANLKRIVFHPVLNWSSWFSWNCLYFNHYVYQCCNSRGCNFLLCYESVVQIFGWGLLHPMDASRNNFTWDWQLITNFKIYIQRSFFLNFFESSLLICFLWFY